MFFFVFRSVDLNGNYSILVCSRNTISESPHMTYHQQIQFGSGGGEGAQGHITLLLTTLLTA